MLARLETLYLGILRVVILVVATLALFAAVVGLVGAAPSLLRQLGVVAAPEPKGGTLGEFIAAKKLTATDDSRSSPTPTISTPAEDAVHPDLAASAKALRSYANGRDDPSEAEWREQLVASVDRVPVEAADAYISSAKELTSQLAVSTGKKLTAPQLAELMGWHEQRFLANAAAANGEAAADAAQSSLTLYAAASAFLLFILITFTFLFVKIERSLRVVRTRPAEDIYA